jgi:hypothetical protein
VGSDNNSSSVNGAIFGTALTPDGTNAIILGNTVTQDSSGFNNPLIGNSITLTNDRTPAIGNNIVDTDGQRSVYIGNNINTGRELHVIIGNNILTTSVVRFTIIGNNITRTQALPSFIIGHNLNDTIAPFAANVMGMNNDHFLTWSGTEVFCNKSHPFMTPTHTALSGEGGFFASVTQVAPTARISTSGHVSPVTIAMPSNLVMLAAYPLSLTSGAFYFWVTNGGASNVTLTHTSTLGSMVVSTGATGKFLVRMSGATYTVYRVK